MVLLEFNCHVNLPTRGFTNCYEVPGKQESFQRRRVTKRTSIFQGAEFISKAVKSCMAGLISRAGHGEVAISQWSPPPPSPSMTDGWLTWAMAGDSISRIPSFTFTLIWTSCVGTDSIHITCVRRSSTFIYICGHKKAVWCVMIA